MAIGRIAVIGAGVMGSGIAAHCANAGVSVLLGDVVAGAAAQAVALMARTDPAPLMHASFARRITPLDLPAGLDRLAEADWIIEAVVERPAVKAALYHQLDAVRRPGSLVSSNTSTIPLETLLAGQSGRFAEDFLITHFFNPPRYMRLLELVSGPHTRAGAVAEVAAFADQRLGKGVVFCRDRPGFIANRIGSFWIQCALNAALDLGLGVEEADAVAGRPMGLPKTGVFGLLDLVGLDLVPQITASLTAALPAADRYREIQRPLPLLDRLIAEGFTGRKGKGGFYRLVAGGDGTGGGAGAGAAGGAPPAVGQGTAKVRQAIDLVSGVYRPLQPVRLESIEAAKGGLRALVEHQDRGGRFARTVLVETLGYAAGLVPEVVDRPEAIDRAMRLGYNWRWGPFELIDRLGPDWLAEALIAAGRPVPPLLACARGRSFYRLAPAAAPEQVFPAVGPVVGPAVGPAVGRPVPEGLGSDGRYAPIAREPGVLLLSDVQRAGPPVRRNGSAALWDVGDGVLCLEFTGKMNALDQETLAMLRTACALIPASGGRWRALVIHNEGENFSVGANLGLAMFAINVAAWPQIEALVADGQDTYRALRSAPFPVVGAPAGMALGGGCELLLHCHAVEAHAETYIGLVEAGVGLLPAWGGSTEMVIRHMTAGDCPGGPMPALSRVFETIGQAKVAKSAFEARELGFLRETDGIVMNRDRVLAAAKARALAMADDPAFRPPPLPEPLHLPGPTAKAAFDLAVASLRAAGKATAHDTVVADHIATVVSGGDTDLLDGLEAADLLALERREFMALVRTPATIDRIGHMLRMGKPLRN